ncbi:MAG: Na+/H+ antiporter [Chloroflexi bacterium 54-19]|nr:MAG: Na+/H+ antiporter [Chloroflexi bacterium 54-19]
MALLVVIAERLRIPYPIFLVIGGLAIGFIPGLPKIELDPELVFVLFLPPILEEAAYFTPIRDFKANIRPILLLSIGLVIFTTLMVGLAGHYLLGLDWAVAFVLGAIVAPPDAAAATSVMENMRLPRRIVTILEGESLVNDASSLVLYKVAVAAVATGVFSFENTVLNFVVASVGGVVLGVAIGWLTVRLSHKFIGISPIFILISFLFSFGTYLLGEAIGVSGVLAVVAHGLYLGRHLERRLPPQLRVTTIATWELVVFLFNGIIFILIGLQLRNILESLSSESIWMLLGQAALICATVIAVRFLWVFPATYLPRWLSEKVRQRDPSPPWQAVVIIGWAGMRGVVSLAAALSLPFMTEQNTPFPDRDLVIFLTFSVILVTLVVQGLSLPFLIRSLGVTGDPHTNLEGNLARLAAAEAGRTRLAELASTDYVSGDRLNKLQNMYDKRVKRYTLLRDGEFREDNLAYVNSYQHLKQELMMAELEAVIKLRDTGVINDITYREIQRDFDLVQLQMDSLTNQTNS